MMQTSSRPKQQIDFSGLRLRESFNATLCSTYIAKARFINALLIEVTVLDCSHIADTLRTQPKVAFEIEVGNGLNLHGSAITSLGASYIGPNQRRLIDVALHLEEACEECFASPVLQWLT